MINRNNLAKYTVYLSILILGLVMGYLFGNRERVNNLPDETKITGPNNSIQNSLSSINTEEILGSGDTQNIGSVGQFYYKTLDDQQTEVFLRINNAPVGVKSPATGREHKIPDTLSIFITRISDDGLDFVYEKIGELTFNPPENGIRKGSFSTNLALTDQGNSKLSNAIRIILDSENEETKNIFSENNPDLPQKVRERPAPYFWVNL